MLLKLSVLAFTIVVGSAQSSGDSVTSLIEATKGYFTSDVSLRSGRGGRRRSSTRRTTSRSTRRKPAARRTIVKKVYRPRKPAKRVVQKKPRKIIKKKVKKARKIIKKIVKKAPKIIFKAAPAAASRLAPSGVGNAMPAGCNPLTQVGGYYSRNPYVVQDEFCRQEYSDEFSRSWYKDSGSQENLRKAQYTSLLRFVFASCNRGDIRGSVSQSEFQNALMKGISGGDPMTMTHAQAKALFEQVLFKYEGHKGQSLSFTFQQLDRFITNQAKQRAMEMFKEYSDQPSRLSETSFLALMDSQGCSAACVNTNKLWQKNQGWQTGYVTPASFSFWASDLLKVQEVVDFFYL